MQDFSAPLIAWTDRGLYCAAGGFYIDPHRAVDVAVVTHAHSDHARRGSGRYVCVASSEGLLRARLGKNISVRGVAYGEKFRMGDVVVSLHSAGHILGSSQVRVEYGGEIWVASGDYKRDPDPSCEPFEIVPCDTFITEATFGTPKYAWKKETRHGEAISAWWREAAARGANCVLFGYSLGKAQRILAELAPHAEKPVLIHDTIHELTECYRREGRALAPTRLLKDAVRESKGDLFAPPRPLEGEMILAPPSILDEDWAECLGRYETAFASGWMQGGPGNRYDRGFVMSDHADWNDLNRTIRETGARRVYVQHRNGALVRHLRTAGIEAYPADFLEPKLFARQPGRNLELF